MARSLGKETTMIRGLKKAKELLLLGLDDTH
jgi:hypothetical protein